MGPTLSRFSAGWVAISAALSAVWVWSCGEDRLRAVNSCEHTFECEVGEICSGGRCRSVRHYLPEEGTGGDPGAGGVPGTGGTSGEGGQGGGVGGAGGSADQTPPVRVTFAPNDYRRCFDSLECAVFGGDCLIEIPLSRPLPDGRDHIRLSDLDPSLEEGEGICGAACTNEPRACDSLVVTGPDGQSRPSTCQLIYVGESPYPEGPVAFPVELDLQAMARGVPHASICRPPFQYAEAHSASFCAKCTEAAHCGDTDACWLDRAYASTPSGICVQRCDLQSDCPFGFRCTDVDEDEPHLVGEAGSYCLPLAGTCERCLDRDGDQRGVGHCGPLDEPFTEVDCDDSNSSAYFDAARPDHPFPDFCGEFDLNCNGISDQVEQLGSEAHCGFCNDRCSGEVARGRRGCVEGDGGDWSCVAICEPGWADCNDDVEDGCETELEDGMLWARDADGDGRGDPTSVRYFCEGTAPEGWVQNVLDCNDADATIYGGGEDYFGIERSPAPELCDGLDNDCNGFVDEGRTLAPAHAVGIGDEGFVQEEEPCDTGLHGVCGLGRWVCKAQEEEGEPLARMICEPEVDVAAQKQAMEICNGLDDDCDGEVDEDVDYFAERGQSNPNGAGAPAECEVEGGVGICGKGVYECGVNEEGEPGWVCVPNEPQEEDPIGDGIDSNCDGIDGDLEGSIFVRPVAGGGTLNGNDANDGSAQAPVATLARAIELACEGRGRVVNGDGEEEVLPCRDIYLDEGVYPSREPVRIPSLETPGEEPFVRIYGGFSASIQCEYDECRLNWERPENTRSVIARSAPAPSPKPEVYAAIYSWFGPYGSHYAAIEGDGSGPMELLLDRVNVEVYAPDASDSMPEGSSAPAQIGIECPSTGCGRLVLSDVRVWVESALSGAPGEAGKPGELPPTGNNGKNGCSADDASCDYGASIATCSVPYTSFQTSARRCEDGSTPHGGAPGGTLCAVAGYSKVTERVYWVNLPLRTIPLGASRGSNGAMGEAGSYVSDGVPSLVYVPGAGPLLHGLRYSAATRGRSGTGGRGGTGTSVFQRVGVGNWAYVVLESRGGAGGAGGCNGTAGGRGGDGGSSIGMILIPPEHGDLRLELPGSFEVAVGRGGDGGAGGPGGSGAPGGWGGSGSQMQEGDSSSNGREGGDGGGGGGGAGGHGGHSIGIWQVCNRHGGSAGPHCGIELPALLRASPDFFVSPGESGKGGEGGEGGKRGEKPIHMYLRQDPGARSAQAGTGDSGLDGQRHHLFLSGDDR